MIRRCNNAKKNENADFLYIWKKNKHKYLSALLSTLFLILNSIIKHLNLTVNYSLSLSPFLYIFKYEQTNRTFSSLRSPLPILPKYPQIFQLCINYEKKTTNKNQNLPLKCYFYFSDFIQYIRIYPPPSPVPCIIWG